MSLSLCLIMIATFNWMLRWYDFISGSGLLEFGEFCQLAAKFLVEEDDEALKKELKEAFRIYDKDQQGFITTGDCHMILMMGKFTQNVGMNEGIIEVAKHQNDGMSS